MAAPPFGHTGSRPARPAASATEAKALPLALRWRAQPCCALASSPHSLDHVLPAQRWSLRGGESRPGSASAKSLASPAGPFPGRRAERKALGPVPALHGAAGPAVAPACHAPSSNGPGSVPGPARPHLPRAGHPAAALAALAAPERPAGAPPLQTDGPWWSAHPRWRQADQGSASAVPVAGATVRPATGPPTDPPGHFPPPAAGAGPRPAVDRAVVPPSRRLVRSAHRRPAPSPRPQTRGPVSFCRYRPRPPAAQPAVAPAAPAGSGLRAG